MNDSISAERPAALQIHHLSKTFGQTQALNDVGFTVQKGHIHGLLGGNGSGKSTLIKVLAGVHKGDGGGTIDFAGKPVASDMITPDLAYHLGLRFVHQNPAVFPTMTVAENIALGNGFPMTRGRIDWKTLRGETEKLLERFRIDARPNQMVGELSQAVQTMIAIARALQDADDNAVSALILDEPTASLPDHEVDILLDAVRRFARMGHTIIYVSHRLEEVLDIADAVTVLRDGRHVETRSSEGLTEARLIELIVGRSLARSFAHDKQDYLPDGAVRPDDPILKVDHLSGGPLVDVSFKVRSGEIVGIAGLLGSGRTEIMRMIFGDLPRRGGSIHLEKEPVAFAKARDGMAAGIALVPENRDHEGVFQGQSVMDNLSVGQFSRFMKGLRIDGRMERTEARRSVSDYGVKTQDERSLISSLSGGNQQKVVMGRWIRRDPRLLLLDEPTQGVDVGAREDLYAVIRESAQKGAAVLVVSSDFEELSQICNRIVVLKDGRIVEELTGEQMSRQNVTERVLSSKEKAA